MYILLFSIARNIVLVVLVISHGYSFPPSKLFCLKGSLNLKERWSNFLEVLVRVVRSEWFTTLQHIQGDTRESDGFKKKYSVDIQLEMDLFVQK